MELSVFEDDEGGGKSIPLLPQPDPELTLFNSEDFSFDPFSETGTNWPESDKPFKPREEDEDDEAS